MVALNGEDPKEKLLIFSDGLDVNQILDLHQEFSKEVNVFWMGYKFN